MRAKGSLERDIMHGQVAGYRRQGKPWIRWLDSIKEATGLCLGVLKEAVQVEKGARGGGGKDLEQGTHKCEVNSGDGNGKLLLDSNSSLENPLLDLQESKQTRTTTTKMWCCVVNRHQCFGEDCCLHLNEEQHIFPRHWHLSASTHTVHVQGLILMFAATIPGDGYLWIHVIPWIESWFVCFSPNSSQRASASSFTSFLHHTQRRTTVGRTPLDKWSARRRDLYLTTHNTHNRQTCMLPLRFEPTLSAGERPQTYTLDRVATGTSKSWFTVTVRYNCFAQNHNWFTHELQL